MPHMKLVLQRAKIITPVCSMFEGLIETEVDGWLQAEESRTAPGVEFAKASCQFSGTHGNMSQAGLQTMFLHIFQIKPQNGPGFQDSKLGNKTF